MNTGFLIGLLICVTLEKLELAFKYVESFNGSKDSAQFCVS